MRYLLLPAAIACIAITSCKKDAGVSGTTIAEFTKYTPGNYWVYETFETDSNGNGHPGTQIGGGTVFYDSVYVEKDTVIGSYTYHKVMQPDDPGSPDHIASYYRDSLNYEVDVHGRIVFAPYSGSILFTRIIGQSTATADSATRTDLMTGDVGKSMSTPAGAFTTTAMVTKWTFYPYSGNGGVHYRYQYARYAAGIGMVSETLPFYISIPTYTERRLLRYHVQ